MNKIWEILIFVVILLISTKSNGDINESNIPESNVGIVTPAAPNVPAEEIRKIDRIQKKNQADEAKDALIIKRLQKDIQKASDTIEFDKKQLEGFPWPYKSLYHWSYKKEELVNILDLAKTRWQLLDNQEKNYKNIIYLVDKYRVPGVDITDIKNIQAEKCRVLGIDIISEKKKLIDCQSKKRDMELAADTLRQKIEQMNNDYVNYKNKKK
jgi:hypothetical protein